MILLQANIYTFYLLWGMFLAFTSLYLFKLSNNKNKKHWVYKLYFASKSNCTKSYLGMKE